MWKQYKQTQQRYAQQMITTSADSQNNSQLISLTKINQPIIGINKKTKRYKTQEYESTQDNSFNHHQSKKYQSSREYSLPAIKEYPKHKQTELLYELPEQSRIIDNKTQKDKKRLKHKGKQTKKILQIKQSQLSPATLRKKIAEIAMNRKPTILVPKIKIFSNRRASYMQKFEQNLENIRLAKNLLSPKASKELRRSELDKFYCEHKKLVNFISRCKEEQLILYEINPSKKQINLKLLQKHY